MHLQVVAVSMSKVQKVPSLMFWKNSSLATIHRPFWTKSNQKQMPRPCVDVFSKWVNHFTVVANAAWIQLVCCASTVSNSRHIDIINTKWERPMEVVAVIAVTLKLGNRIRFVMNIK